MVHYKDQTYEKYKNKKFNRRVKFTKTIKIHGQVLLNAFGLHSKFGNKKLAFGAYKRMEERQSEQEPQHSFI